MNKWEAIKSAHEKALPMIIKNNGYSDPYFFNWEFTPIERLAWGDIRCSGLLFFPQCPVAGKFIDFGDPIKKIGIELARTG